MNCSKKGCKLLKDRKIDRRILKSKKSIKSALLTLMRQRKIRDITITELCREADVNRKTFYTYYNSVRDVVLEYEDSIAKEMVKEIFTLDDNKADASIIILSYQHELYKHEAFLRCLFEQDIIYTFEQKLRIRLGAAAFKRYRNMRDVSPKKLKEAELALDYIVSGIVSLQINWFFSESTVSFSSLVRISRDYIHANVAILLSN